MFEEIKSQDHASLKGAEGRQVHYRPDRYHASQLDSFPHRQVVLRELNGSKEVPVNLVDFSANGLAIQSTTKLKDLDLSRLYGCDIALSDQLKLKKVIQIARVEDKEDGTFIGAKFEDSLLNVEDLFKKSRETFYLKQATDVNRRVSRVINHNTSSPFKSVVSDMKFYLETIHEELERIERESRAEKVLLFQDEQERFLSGFYGEFGPIFQRLIIDLNESIKGTSEDELRNYAVYIKECLGDLLFKSPLWDRAYRKPFGYSGDFVIMQISYWDNYRGDNFFGKLLTKAGIMMSAPTATRTRADLVKGYITKTVTESTSQPVDVLSIACGPAKEVNEFLKESYPKGRKINFYLIDQDKHALDCCHKGLSEHYFSESDVRNNVAFKFINASIRLILKDENFTSNLGKMDLIYTVGLFDYLPLDVSQRLTQRLFGMLKPDGRLLIGNLVRACTSKAIFDLALDWPMFYRSQEELLQFLQPLSTINNEEQPFEALIDSEQTGVNLFLNVKRRSQKPSPQD